MFRLYFLYPPTPTFKHVLFPFFWWVEKRPIWGRDYFCGQRKLKLLRVNSNSVLLHESKFISNTTYLSWRARRERKVSLQLQKEKRERFFQAKNGEKKTHRLQEQYRQPSALTHTLLGIITPGRWQVLRGNDHVCTLQKKTRRMQASNWCFHPLQRFLYLTKTHGNRLLPEFKVCTDLDMGGHLMVRRFLLFQVGLLSFCRT